MKKYKDLLWTGAGIAVVALLIFVVWKGREPEPIIIDLSEEPGQSSDHRLVGEILKDTEAFVEAEDASLVVPLTKANPVASAALNSPSPLPVHGAPLPIGRESQPAPNIDEVELSPALKRSLAASASLRTDDYINPSSELNLQRVETLRSLRKERHSQ